MTSEVINTRFSLIIDAMSGRMGTFVVGLFLFCIYLGLGWFIMKPEIMWSPDEGAKWLQMHYLRWEDGLKIDIRYEGIELDPTLRFVPSETSKGLLKLQNGQMFFRRLPLFPALSKVFYSWLGHRGLVFLPAFGGALICSATLQLLNRKDRRPAMWVLAAFASPIFIYALLFWEHTLAGGLALVAAWLVLRDGSATGLSPRPVPMKWVGAGLLFGISTALRLEVIIFAGAFLVAAWLILPKQRRGIVFAGIILVLGLFIQAIVMKNLFGQPTPDNAAFLFYPLTYLSTAKWGALRDLLIGPASDEAIDPGMIGSMWAVIAVVAFLLSIARQTSRFIRNLWLASMVVYILLAASFLFTATPYRSTHGLLFTTPWLLLGYCRAQEIWSTESKKARIVILTASLGLVGYIGGAVFLRASSPHGGLEWGSRFFLTFFPLIAIMAGWKAAGSLRQRQHTHLILAALMFLGLGFQIRGLMSINKDKSLGQDLIQELSEAREMGYLLSSDLWWLPFNSTSIYAEEAIYIFQDEEREAAWLDLLISEQVSDVAVVTLNKDWLEHALITRPGFPFRLDQTRQIDNLWVLYLSK